MPKVNPNPSVHLLDLMGHIHRNNAGALSRIDPNNPDASGPDWTTEVMTGLFGTGGRDPDAIRQARKAYQVESKYKPVLAAEGIEFTPGLTADAYERQRTEKAEGKAKKLRVENQANAMALSSIGIKEQNEIAREQLRYQKESGELAASTRAEELAANRIHELEILESGQANDALQWERRMEYEDKKTQASEDEAAIEGLIAGLINLAALSA